jgi:hypothetical protein
MESDTSAIEKKATLHEEIEGIHFVNSLYWNRKEAVTLEARAEYERRKQRLEEIRAELAKLQSS